MRSTTPDLDRNPPGFSYNPSAWSQRIPIAVLAAIAAVLSAWLALYQWRVVDEPFEPLFAAGSTAAVLDSDVSHRMRAWIGAPDAALGAIAYLGDAIFGIAGSTRRWQYRPWMVILFGVDVIPLGIVSAVLVFLQGAVVGHWCTLCLVTAVISLVLVVMAWDEVWATCAYLRRIWQETHDKRVVWHVFWGQPDRAARHVRRATEGGR